MDAGLPKLGGCEPEEMTCSSSTSPPGPFIGPLLPSSSTSDVGGGVEVVEEGLEHSSGPPPVFEINKIIDNLSEAFDKSGGTMEE